AANLRHAVDVRLFEIGLTYWPQADEKLPNEQPRLVLVLTGRRQADYWGESGAKPGSLDFFDLKGVVETLAADLHLPEVTYRPSTLNYLHPGKAAELLIRGRGVGSFGQLHPRVAEAYGLSNR